MAQTSQQEITAAAMTAVDLLRQKNLKLATAESCTAGLLSATITAVPGASAVFDCGVAAYAAEIKREVLGVPADVLEQHGTVSSETAAAMADGVRRMSGASIGVAITGVAGPDPSEGKPVGTVHIALANADRVWLQKLEPRTQPTDRETVRLAAVSTALSMVIKYAEAYPVMVAGSLPITPPQPLEVVIPKAAPSNTRRRFLATILPWRGDSRRERILKIGAITVAACLLLVAIYGIHQLVSITGNQSLYDDLQSMYTDEQAVAQNGSDMLPRFASLYLQNADIGGWIRVDGTDISYPVMKNAGSDYYANHNFRQQSSTYGVPYFDSKNSLVSASERNKSFIIYGNNTGDGQMFSELPEYRDADFFKEHIAVDMSTLYASDKWLLFGVMVLDPEEINAFAYATTTFENDEAFLQYLSEIRKRSLINTDIDVHADDRLLLLVTQAEREYGFDNATLVVVGRRLRDGEAIPDAETLHITYNNTVLMPRIWVRMNRNASTTRTTATTETQSSSTDPSSAKSAETEPTATGATTRTTTSAKTDVTTTKATTAPTKPPKTDGPTGATDVTGTTASAPTTAATEPPFTDTGDTDPTTAFISPTTTQTSGSLEDPNTVLIAN